MFDLDVSGKKNHHFQVSSRYFRHRPSGGLEHTHTHIFWLVVWNMAFIFHFIYGNKIIPADELIFFKMVKTTNQYYMYIIHIYIYVYIYVYIPIYTYDDYYMDCSIHPIMGPTWSLEDRYSKGIGDWAGGPRCRVGLHTIQL